MRLRTSLGLQLALVAAAAALVAVAAWGAAAYLWATHYVYEEVSHRAMAYASEISRQTARFDRELGPRDWRTFVPLLERLMEDPGVLDVALVGPQNKVLARPAGASPAEGSESSLSLPVRGPDRQIVGWIRLRYSAEAFLGSLWREGRNALLLLASVTAICLGGAIYGACWLLVFRPIQRIMKKRLALAPRGEPLRPEDRNELGALFRGFRDMERGLAESEENLRVLLAASKTMTSEMDIHEIHNRVLDLVWRRLDRDPCLIWRQDEDELLRIKNFRNFPPELVKRLKLRPGEGAVGLCFANRAPQMEKDPARSEAWPPELRGLEVRSAAHFPLVVDGRAVGALTAFSRHKDFFNPERALMVSSLMEFLSLATKSARLFEEMQKFNRRMESEVSSTTRELAQTNVRLIRRVRELRALYDVAMSASSPGELLAKTVEHVADLLEAGRAEVFLWSERDRVFRSSRPGKAERELPSGAFDPWRERLSQGETVVLRSPAETGVFWDDLPEGGAVALAPLNSERALLGAVAVADKQGGRFEEEDLRVMALFARHLSETLRGTQIRLEREQRIRDLTALQEVSSVLSGEPDLAEVLKETTRIVAAALGADICAFMLYDEATQELVTQPGAHGLPDAEELLRVRVDDPLSTSGRVFLSGKPFLSDDALKDPAVNQAYARRWNVRSLMSVPLIVEKRPIGVLRVGHRAPNVFSQDHVRLASLVAEQAAVVVQNARLYQQVQQNVRELERLSNSKTEFLSMVSHELRTPITALKGFLSILQAGQAGPLTEKQDKFLALSKQSLMRLSLLINDLVDSSSIEAGRWASCCCRPRRTIRPRRRTGRSI
jgi:GAF domain-containing protein